MKVGDLVKVGKRVGIVVNLIGKGCPVGNIRVMCLDDNKPILMWEYNVELISESR